MGVPTHLKAIVGVFSALFIAAGTRDIFAPGHGLPLPDDDKLIASVFGAPPVGACGKKDIGCVPGRMLFVSQGWGVMVVTIALVKCALIFSHQEGTVRQPVSISPFVLFPRLFLSLRALNPFPRPRRAHAHTPEAGGRPTESLENRSSLFHKESLFHLTEIDNGCSRDRFTPLLQFLRRNLFIVLGLSDIAFSAMIYSHEGYFNGQGASAMPFVLVMAIEGLALLHDAFMRDRKVKKAK